MASFPVPSLEGFVSAKFASKFWFARKLSLQPLPLAPVLQMPWPLCVWWGLGASRLLSHLPSLSAFDIHDILVE